MPLVELPHPLVPTSRRIVVWGMSRLLAACIPIACLPRGMRQLRLSSALKELE